MPTACSGLSCGSGCEGPWAARAFATGPLRPLAPQAAGDSVARRRGRRSGLGSVVLPRHPSESAIRKRRHLTESVPDGMLAAGHLTRRPASAGPTGAQAESGHSCIAASAGWPRRVTVLPVTIGICACFKFALQSAARLRAEQCGDGDCYGCTKLRSDLTPDPRLLTNATISLPVPNCAPCEPVYGCTACACAARA
jgi:hypothetical protein